MPRQYHQQERGETSGKAVWDTGSSLYDSYELAAVRGLLDKRLLAGARPLPDESKQQIVIVGGARPAGRKKVTLRALFRTLASWAIRPRQAHACTCVGIAHGGAVEPVVASSHGKV